MATTVGSCYKEAPSYDIYERSVTRLFVTALGFDGQTDRPRP